jgi:outer membrane receptor for ferric coprogen and ferric-rhodotorulic acid
MTIQCKQCNKLFEVSPYRKDTAKYCSRECKDKSQESKSWGKPFGGNRPPWNKGKKGVMPTPWNKGIKTGKPAWNSGKKMDKPAWNKGKEWNEWMDKDEQKKVLKNLSHFGEDHWNWKGGITDENHSFRNSKKYKEWRMKVLQRDRFTCIKCGYRSKKRRDIRVDHIKPFCLYPILRLDVDNGRTLCISCDNKYGWNYFKNRVK